MGLNKAIVADRTGVTAGHHVAQQVAFSESKVAITVASYVDEAAKDAGKSFVAMSPEVFDYDGASINKTATAYAEDLLLTLDKYAGATQV